MFSFFKKFKKPADAPLDAPQDESVEAAEDEEISDAELERQALSAETPSEEVQPEEPAPAETVAPAAPTPPAAPPSEESKEYWQGRTQSQWARGPETDQASEEVVHLWVKRNDAGSYMVIGDPLARLHRPDVKKGAE